MPGLLHASYPRAVRWTLLTSLLGLGGATFNHLRDLYVGGWLPYVGAPSAVNAYWTCLTFLDPLAAALLIFRTRAGLILTLGLMLSDGGISVGMAEGELSGALLAQTEFLGFVLGSAAFLWQAADGRRP